MKIREIMTTDVSWLKPDDTVETAANIMQKLDVGILPICNENKDLIGLLTDRDIVIRNVAKGKDAKDTTVKLYDFLFDIENVDEIPEGKTFDDYLNRSSVTTVENAKVEPALADAQSEERFQFVRCGYFVKDSKHSNVFNRIVGLKDSFPKTK